MDVNILDSRLETPLYCAIKKRNFEMVKYMIEECGADYENTVNQKRSVLYYSGYRGSNEITRYLLSKGAKAQPDT